MREGLNSLWKRSRLVKILSCREEKTKRHKRRKVIQFKMQLIKFKLSVLSLEIELGGTDNKKKNENFP